MNAPLQASGAVARDVVRGVAGGVAEGAGPALGETVRGVTRGLVLPAMPAEWRLSTLVGRLGEVSGDRDSAALTLAFRLVVEAQRRGEPVAWIGRHDHVFFPPDVAAMGIDLAALPVIWTPDTLAAARVADLLLRSGGFGLVVLDVGAGSRLPMHALTRLAALAKQHESALLCLTEKNDARPSLGSLVSLRAHACRTRHETDRFRCELRVLKDKRRGPGWRHVEICRGPDGLC